MRYPGTNKAFLWELFRNHHSLQQKCLFKAFYTVFVGGYLWGNDWITMMEEYKDSSRFPCLATLVISLPTICIFECSGPLSTIICISLYIYIRNFGSTLQHKTAHCRNMIRKRFFHTSLSLTVCSPSCWSCFWAKMEPLTLESCFVGGWWCQVPSYLFYLSWRCPLTDQSCTHFICWVQFQPLIRVHSNPVHWGFLTFKLNHMVGSYTRRFPEMWVLYRQIIRFHRIFHFKL